MHIPANHAFTTNYVEDIICIILIQLAQTVSLLPDCLWLGPGLYANLLSYVIQVIDQSNSQYHDNYVKKLLRKYVS